VPSDKEYHTEPLDLTVVATAADVTLFLSPRVVGMKGMFVVLTREQVQFLLDEIDLQRTEVFKQSMGEQGFRKVE